MMYITNEQQVVEEHRRSMEMLNSCQSYYSKLQHILMPCVQHCAAKQAEIEDSKYRYEHEYMECPPNYGRDIQLLLDKLNTNLEVVTTLLAQGEWNDEYLF